MAIARNSKMHRIRHRGRLESVHKRPRHLNRHADLAVAEMNAIGGVSGVTRAEVIQSIRANVTINPAGVRDIRARLQMGVTTVAGVEALGIPIA